MFSILILRSVSPWCFSHNHLYGTIFGLLILAKRLEFVSFEEHWVEEGNSLKKVETHSPCCQRPLMWCSDMPAVQINKMELVWNCKPSLPDGYHTGMKSSDTQWLSVSIWALKNRRTEQRFPDHRHMRVVFSYLSE